MLAFLLIATSIPVVTEAAAKPVCQKATTLHYQYNASGTVTMESLYIGNLSRSAKVFGIRSSNKNIQAKVNGLCYNAIWIDRKNSSHHIKDGEKTTISFIKEQAYKLFAIRGFKDVTMKDICEITGLSRGGLYRHYDSTDQIFSEIIETFLVAQNNSFKEKMEAKIPAPQILDEILQKYRDEMIDSESSLSIAIYEYFSRKKIEGNDNLLIKQYKASFNSWDALIQYGISRKEFNQVDIAGVFDLLVFAYQGVRMYSQLMNIDDSVPEKIIEQIKKILIKEG